MALAAAAAAGGADDRLAADRADVARRPRRGRPATGRAVGIARHVKLSIETDDALCRISIRSGESINALIRRAVDRLVHLERSISGRQIIQGRSEPS
jgi:hypothetical protein